MKNALRSIILAGIIAAPIAAASAQQNSAERSEWTACTSDAQCTVINGLCNTVAVRRDYKEQADAYFAEQRKLVKCRQNFWQPKLGEAGAKCWQERCQTVGKD